MSVSEGYNNKKKDEELMDEENDETPEIKEKTDEDDIVKKLSNMAIESLLNKYEDVSNNTVDNIQSLEETNKESTQLTQKIDKVTNSSSMKEKNVLMYDKINELNSKMNELTALIQ
jgi:hypothetical protein